MSAIPPELLSTNIPHRKPAFLDEPHVGYLRDEASLLTVQAAFDAHKDLFVRKTFERFFFRGKKIVFGAWATNASLCQHVIKRVQAHPDWVVHAKIPLQIGGRPDLSNMVLMLKDTHLKLQADIDDQLLRQCFHETPARTLRLSIPTYPLHLPVIEGKLHLPLLKDTKQRGSLELPLDMHTPSALSDQGFESLIKQTKLCRRQRLSPEDREEAEDFIRQSDGFLGSTNRIRRQLKEAALLKYG